MSTQALSALYTHGLRQTLHGRRLIGLAAIVLAPALLAGGARLIAPVDLSPSDLEPVVFFPIGLGLVVPVLALFLGIDVVRGELSDGSIVHLVTRPVPRASIFLARLASAITATFASAAVSLTLAAMVVGGDVAQTTVDVLQVAALASLAYTPLFALLGALTKRGMLIGLIYIVSWETVVAATPLFFRTWTVAYWLRSIVIGQDMVQTSFSRGALSGTPAGFGTSVLVLTGIALVAALAGAIWFQQRELAGPEPE